MPLTKDGLPRKAFAYAPDAEPSTWKLPFLTKDGAPDPKRLKAAAAALGEAGIPSAFLPAVRAKLRSAFRRLDGDAADLPEAVKERELRRADGSLLLREATVLLDKAATYATLVFAPNGDALVIPSWDGAFYYAKTPWIEPSPPPTAAGDDSLMSKWNAMDATGVLKDLLMLKGNEADEPADAALLDKAIGAVTDFIRNENAQIVSECEACSHAVGCICTECSCSNAVHVTIAAESAGRALDYALATLGEAAALTAFREAGKRNSGKDQTRIQAMHDLGHDLGAVHTKGRSYAGMSESGSSSSDADSLVAAVVEVATGSTPEAIRFAESSYDSAAIVDLREADPIFDDATRSVTITPIRPGFGNARDNFFYPAGTLREATQKGLFSGLKMFRNHPRKTDEKELPERSVTDWFAATKESTWDEAGQKPRVRIQVLNEEDYGKFKVAPEHIAFSILGSGMAKPGTVNGKTARVVESFNNIRSVDWVTEAGAGGAIDFAESASEEFEMTDIAKMTADQLKEANPELYAQLTAKPAETPDPATAAAPATAVAESAEPPAWAASLISKIDTIEARESGRAQAAKLAETKTHAIELVKATVAEAAPTLVGKAKDAIATKFAEATVGEGGTFADDDALKVAVTAEAIATQALLKSIFGEKPSPVGGASGASGREEGELTEAERRVKGLFPSVSDKGLGVATEMAEAWGAAKPPSRQKLVFEPGDSMPWDSPQPIVGGSPMGVDSRESEQPESKLSEAGKQVENELAAALGLSN